MTSSAPAPADASERVLILTPVGRDAPLAEATLQRAGLVAHVCVGLAELRREVARGAGALLLAEEALPDQEPAAWLGSEPGWSQLPLVVLTGRGGIRRVEPLLRLERRWNATFLERPVTRATLVSALRAALESRRRQYAVHELLEELEAGVRQRDEFLAMLGHELRNPLGVISNAAELLAQEPAPSDTTRFAGGLIRRQTRNLARILDDLLDVSRVTRGKLELRCQPVELVEIARCAVESAQPQIRERRHRLRVSLPDEPIWVHADPTRLEQILANLLGNACKYTEPGGNLRLSLAARGPDAEIRVRDDGRGMAEDFVERAFDLFAQAELGSGGLGLGLPLSRRLAELHRGSLTASSPGIGKGSEFVLRLPRLERGPDRPSPGPARGASRAEAR